MGESGGITGLFGSVKEAAGGVFEKIFSIPDKPSKAWQRKALYIIYDVGILLLVYVLATVMIGHSVNPLQWVMSPSSTVHAISNGLQNPGISTLMPIGMGVFGAGMGVAFLLRDILPKRAHRTAGQVMALATPILIIVGCTSLVLAAGRTSGKGPLLPHHFSLTKSMTSRYYQASLLILPTSIFAASRIPEKFKDDEIIISCRPPPMTRNRRHRPLSAQVEASQQRMAQTQADMHEETRRTHEEGNWLSRLFRRSPRPVGMQGEGNAERVLERL